MSGPLETDATLRAAIDSVDKTVAMTQEAKGWADSLSTFLKKVKKDIPAALQSETYLKSLWDDTTISSTGNGSVIIAPAMANEAFRQWFFQKVATPLSADLIEAQNYLVDFHDETKKRLKDLCGRTPHLKVNRVFCAIYPEHFTTIADEGAIRFLHRSMGGGKSDHIVHIHHAIKNRIDSLLGSVTVGDFSAEFCARLSLPWYLYEKTMSELDPNQPSPQPFTSLAALRQVQTSTLTMS